MLVLLTVSAVPSAPWPSLDLRLRSSSWNRWGVQLLHVTVVVVDGRFFIIEGQCRVSVREVRSEEASTGRGTWCVDGYEIPGAKMSGEVAVTARAGILSEVSVIIDSLWYPLPYGALKRHLHVCRATGRCPENCLPLSHLHAANPHVWYARRCLDRRRTTSHGNLQNLRRKWSLRSRKLLRERPGSSTPCDS